VSATAALARYREETGDDSSFAAVTGECAKMLADALTPSKAAAASRARVLDRARALLAESHQPLTMRSDQMYRLLARYQRSLLDLVLLLEEDSPVHPAV
jgi:hypothetical protein